jgi:hypothetical protein
MKRKELLKRCAILTDAFDGLENVYDNGKKDTHKFVNLCDEVSGFSKKMESIAPKLAANFTDYYSEFMDALKVAFGFGYTLGQSFDSPYPEIQKAIESIKGVIKEKALLPYLPREKKGGDHGKERN